MAADTRRARIAARFDAASGYDGSAGLQQRCSLALMERVVAAFPVSPPRRILEIGCGTGFLTQHLATRFATADLLATDLAPAMVARARARLSGTRARFAVMDGERPDIDGPFDLIVSSLCVQWFSERREGLRRLCDRLAPGGRMMVATLLDGSLNEWRHACAAVGTPCGVPDYPTPAGIGDDWPPDGTGSWEAMDLRDPVTDARAFLRGLRAIGASVPREGNASASAAQLRRAMHRFDAHDDGMTAERERAVTYRIGFGTFRRDAIPRSRDPIHPAKGLNP